MKTVITLIIPLVLIGLLFARSSIKTFSIIAVIGLFAAMAISMNGVFILVLGVLTFVCAVLSITTLRKQLVSGPFFPMFKKMLPPLSKTEQEAIDAGTVWWDGQLFTGKPDWNSLIKIDKPVLTDDEQAFIDGPATELCRMSNAWKISHDWNLIPDEILSFVRNNGFLGMIIPKEYGGLELSAVAQSEVLIKVSNTGAAITYLVAVPNSLGPGELLIKYGTDDQKNYYLPRLAEGKEVPCFALTAPLAGSDATSIPDNGVICKGLWEGKEIVGMRLNFNKRYITLAPIATLVGLAFKLSDPDHLIGEIDDYGITCALLPRDTKGLVIGRRHLPIGDAFLNGPIEGENVFVPLDYIIGGSKMAGKGWRMLVNCLSVGRCITLPSGGAAYAKRSLMGTTAYASLRKQFGVPIKQFEGIQKPLARMAGFSYIVNAARLHTIQAVDGGEKPAVPSAILKYHCTEMARQCAIDAMDIHGGKAVMKGPKNYIASGYESIPVSITVEGANILTRNLMIFGQGATRSHPYVLREMELAAQESDDAVIDEFDDILFKHVGFMINNGVRSLLLALTGSRLEPNPGHPKLGRYYAHLSRMSSAFALIADLSLLSLQSKLKSMEMLSARLGDLLSDLYLASMVLKHYENDGCPEEDFVVVQWSLDYLMNHYQEAFSAIIDNYPSRVLANTLKFTVFPVGMHFKAPNDDLERKLAAAVTENTATRDRMVAGLFMEAGENNPLAHVNDVFLESFAHQPLQEKIRVAIKDKKLPRLQGLELINAAREAEVLSEIEARQLVDFDERLMSVIHVDEFDQDEIIRTQYEDYCGDVSRQEKKSLTTVD